MLNSSCGIMSFIMSSEIDENITNVDDQWNVPENVYFYESIDDNGRVLSYTNSVEMARSCNYDPSKYISKDDVKISEVDYLLYLKEKCPMLSAELKMQRAKNKTRAQRDNLLKDTDCYMISDYPIEPDLLEKIKQYRVYLRNFTKQENWYNTPIKTLSEFVNS